MQSYIQLNVLLFQKLWTPSLRNFLHSPVTFSSLGTILSLVLWSQKNLNLCSSLAVKGQVSFQYKTDITFLPSTRRYSSGWALAFWIVSLHFSLFFICSDDEASNGTMKKWKECGWKRSWPTDFPFIPSSEADYLVVSLMPNPQPGGPGYPSSSGSHPLTCPAWVTIPVATLPPA
jgi:hypothetical protein